MCSAVGTPAARNSAAISPIRLMLKRFSGLGTLLYTLKLGDVSIATFMVLNIKAIEFLCGERQTLSSNWSLCIPEMTSLVSESIRKFLAISSREKYFGAPSRFSNS